MTGTGMRKYQNLQHKVALKVSRLQLTTKKGKELNGSLKSLKKSQ